MKIFFLLTPAFAMNPMVTEHVTGSFRDTHGCNPSAGYTWCDSSAKCIRSWEEDCSTTKLTATQKNHATQVFKEQDQDHNGRLTSGGVYAALNKLDSSLTETQIQKATENLQQGYTFTLNKFLSTYAKLENGKTQPHKTDGTAQKCSTSGSRGSPPKPCPNGMNCKITNPGHPEYDLPNSGICVKFAITNVPKSCISWHDGCNTCMAKGGVILGCTKMNCKKKGTSYCKKHTDGMKCTGVNQCAPPNDCTGFYDGCNSCGARDGKTTFCSMMYCSKEITHQPYCTTFKDGHTCTSLDDCDTVVAVHG